MDKETVQIVTITEGVLWHALSDDEVVGRGNAEHRPDGRLFLSIDSWQPEVFRLLAAAMLADLPRPLYALADEADLEQLTGWEGAGFTVCRREREYAVPTDPARTGLDDSEPSPQLRIIPVGAAEEAPLIVLDREVRAEVEASVGWQSMPAEILARPADTGVRDATRYAVAVRDGQYVGLARISPLPRRRPRLGLIAVREAHRRQGVARALLAEVLGSLHLTGIATVSTEVDVDNTAAVRLFEGIGAEVHGTAVELVHR